MPRFFASVALQYSSIRSDAAPVAVFKIRIFCGHKHKGSVNVRIVRAVAVKAKRVIGVLLVEKLRSFRVGDVYVVSFARHNNGCATLFKQRLQQQRDLKVYFIFRNLCPTPLRAGGDFFLQLIGAGRDRLFSAVSVRLMPGIQADHKAL